jgi:myo-inositol-1(or 4)-monophosphatase
MRHTRIAVRDRLAGAMREAGALALKTFRGEIKSWTKGASSPVSEADIAVDALLRERLLAIHDAGWLSEETEDDPARSTAASPARTAMTGTLRPPTFWCTKRAGC